MRYVTTVAGCLLLAVASVGCHRTVNTVAVGDSMTSEYKWIQTDSGLSEQATVVSARKDRVNGLLKVQIELLNRRNHDERIVYKFQWLDASGMEITSIASDWQPKVINGRESVMIVGVAPDARVTDCRVKLQENVR